MGAQPVAAITVHQRLLSTMDNCLCGPHGGQKSLMDSYLCYTVSFMSDLIENHIVGFLMMRLIYLYKSITPEFAFCFEILLVLLSHNRISLANNLKFALKLPNMMRMDRAGLVENDVFAKYACGSLQMS